MISVSFAALVPAYTLAIFDIANLPSQLQPILQQNYLETSLEEYLTAKNGYWVATDSDSFSEDIFGSHKGTTITRTRPGLKAPMVVATNNAATQTSPNNGVTPTDFAVEQYTFTPFELSDGINLDLIGTDFAIVNRFRHQLNVSFHQAEQSLDLLARDTFIAGYGCSATYVVTGIAGGTNVTITVDDIRGFDTVITSATNGQLVATSSTYTMPATCYPAGSTTGAYAVTVSLATPAGTNISNMVPFNNGTALYGAPGAPNTARGNGVSGTLTCTFSSGKTMAAGDILVAGDAPAQIYTGGVLHWSKLAAGSSLLQSNLLDAVSALEVNGVPHAANRWGDTEGTYVCHIAPNIARNLYKDSDFKQANQTLGQSNIYLSGQVSQYVGVTFLKNTNAPRISLSAYGGTGYAYLTIVAGQGALIDAAYEGLATWAQSQFNPGYVALDHGIAQILMPAYQDRQGRRMNIDWLTIRDMIAPTDVTRSTVMLTGTAGRRARAVGVWSWNAT